ncbi:metallophosphoesterase family protein [Falsiroseomonas stagni]|uniref:Calcineurin-like phosphoesterase n=1 Tax=Falsiroseomonas stagni DSM 19981 TaxID=1123062 RepID=A0A1I3ZRV4_9PROT|nr:metallophosphoesterase [Falsiroseomonas stagni]SFK46279.1 Calcineurin-like phosphoesterase [Falsiroseomonas stagni DSM 19981]
MPTILQISDTHLSPRNGLFLENIAALRRVARARRPDLTVFSGDLSLDGADRDEDMGFAAELLRAFPGEHLFIPGNHDTGSHPIGMPHQPVNADRMARFRRFFGEGFGAVDLPGWRAIGLNTEIMATGVEEDVQAAFIAETVRTLGARRIALFLHKPVFVTRQDDPTIDVWSIPPDARPGLSPLLSHPALRLIASGHLHMFKQEMEGAVSQIWAPAASFVMTPEQQDGLRGERRCGALLHHLSADAVTTERLDLPDTWAADIKHLTYPG